MFRSKLNWKLAKTVEAGEDMFHHSSLSPIVKQLLFQRGITSEESAEDFLSPDLNDLHQPSQLAMIDEAADRIYQAIENEEKILVFGDYDADGVCSTTVLLKVLSELGADCDFYIPNRFTEGYGPNEEAFKAASERGFKVIITVDCGIASVQEAKCAKELGIDLIITDHHEPQEELPDAYAIIHPKCSPDYPFKELAGVGIAFKLAERLLGHLPEHLLEFVAIGTIADLVPLVDENRILTFYGLRALAQTRNEGLKALMRVCNLKGDVTEEDVGFSIGPRLNSVGRLRDASLAVELLLAEDQVVADDIATEIDAMNNERKEIVKTIADEAEQYIDPEEKEGVIVVAQEGWNEGVLGIVASRIVQKYARPAIVLALDPEKGIAKGSARSIPAFDLFESGMKIKERFTHFGGHSQAAGMTLPIENIELIRQELTNEIKEQLKPEDYKQEVEIAGKLSVSDITEELIESINQLAPFGMDNPKPVFMLKDIPREARQIGADRNHLKLNFQADEQKVDGIGFGLGYIQPLLTKDTPLAVVGELSINEWNGFRKPQIVVQDAAIDEWQLFDFRGRKRTDFSPLLNIYDNHFVLSRKRQSSHPQVEYISYEDTPDELNEMDALYIYDMPEDLNQLKQLIEIAQPKNIYACYSVENSAYLQPFPAREDFIWCYKNIRMKKSLHLNDYVAGIERAKGWDREQVLFISHVFSELGFVKIEGEMITINPSPVKQDLEKSSLYQQRLQQMETEKILYYSNYEQLKNWFKQAMNERETPREEVAYGL